MVRCLCLFYDLVLVVLLVVFGWVVMLIRWVLVRWLCRNCFCGFRCDVMVYNSRLVVGISISS